MTTSLLSNPTRSTLASAVQVGVVLVGAALVSTVCAGCGSVKFYPGEERADSEIGRLLFNSSAAAMNVVTLDGIPHPHPGRTLEILPGAHLLVVKYSQTFIDSGDPAHGDPSGRTAPLTRYGTCSIRFTIEAAQELYVFVDAVADSGLSASAPPTITLRQIGFNQPALFQERCHEESKARFIGSAPRSQKSSQAHSADS
jgi:hypothetical protein